MYPFSCDGDCYIFKKSLWYKEKLYMTVDGGGGKKVSLLPIFSNSRRNMIFFFFFAILLRLAII